MFSCFHLFCEIEELAHRCFQTLDAGIVYRYKDGKVFCCVITVTSVFSACFLTSWSWEGHEQVQIMNMSECHCMWKGILSLQWLDVQFYYCVIHWLSYTTFSLQFSLIKKCYCHHCDEKFGFQSEYARMRKADKRKNKQTNQPSLFLANWTVRSWKLLSDNKHNLSSPSLLLYWVVGICFTPAS